VKGSLTFWKHKNSWVITSKGTAPSGLNISIEPVYVIPLNEFEDLKRTLLLMLDREPKLIPEPDYRDSEFKRTVMAKAVGTKTFREFYKDARCFHLRKAERRLTLEEWPPGPGTSFVGPPAWKCETGTEEIDQLLSNLYKRTQDQGGNEGSRGKRKTKVPHSEST
jgi:hypothetical protein